MTKDNHICVTPSDCARTFTLNSAVTKTFQLDSQAASSATCPIRYNSTTTAAGWLGERIKVAERTEDSWTQSVQNTVNLEVGGYSHSWYDNNPSFNRTARGEPERMFKVDQRSSVLGNIDSLSTSALQKVYDTAHNNPGAWWIIGEEPNALAGEQTMTPTAYAQFFKANLEQIYAADPTAKIVGVYLAHETPDFSNPFQYYTDFYNAWRANYTSFCPEPPLDAIHVNYTPWLEDDNRTERRPRTEWANPMHTLNYANKWRDYIMAGNAGGTLVNEFFSLGTYESCDYNRFADCPTQGQAGRYWQGVHGALSNNQDYPWVGLVMNFATYPTSSEILWHTSVYTNSAVTTKHTYFPVFANLISRNAGFEQGDINGTIGDTPKQWNQCTASPPYFATITGGADGSGTNGTPIIESDYAVKFYTTTTYGCDLWSRKHYFRGDLGTSIEISIDYKVQSGSLNNSDFYVEFYNAAGQNLGSTNSCEWTNQDIQDANWRHKSCTFPLGAFRDARYMEFWLDVFPAGGTSHFRFDNPTVRMVP